MGKRNKIEESVTIVSVNEDRYDIKLNDTVVGRVRLKKFPYCSGLCIMCDLFIEEEYRGKGLGKKVVAEAEKHAKNLRYKFLLCTDVETNISMRKVLLKRDWQDLLVFRNSNTDNIVNLSCIKL